MKKIVGPIAIALLIIGTLGLLASTYIFHWGRTATLVFAACNMLGLFSLIYVAGMAQKEKDRQA